MVVMHNVVSVDGFIADDDPGPLFEWYFNGEHALSAGEMNVVEEAVTPSTTHHPVGLGSSTG